MILHTKMHLLPTDTGAISAFETGGSSPQIWTGTLRLPAQAHIVVIVVMCLIQHHVTRYTMILKQI